MDLATITSKIGEMASNEGAIGAKMKFTFDDGAVMIDGTGEKNEVSNDDGDADTNVIVSYENFQKLLSGDLNPMMAVMGGKIKIKGDMGLAMKLQSMLG